MDAAAQNTALQAASGVPQVSASSVPPPTSYSSITQRLLDQLIAHSSTNNAHYAAANQQLGPFINLPQATSDYTSNNNYMVAANAAANQAHAYQTGIYGLGSSYGNLLLAAPGSALPGSSSSNNGQNLTPSHPYALISSPPTNPNLCSRRGTPIDGRDSSNLHSCIGVHHLGGQGAQQSNGLRPPTPQLTSNSWGNGGSGVLQAGRSGSRALKRSTASGGGPVAETGATSGSGIGASLPSNTAFYMAGGANDEDQLTLALNNHHHQQQRNSNNSSSSSMLRGPKLRRISSYDESTTEESLETISVDPIEQTTTTATIQMQQQIHQNQPVVPLATRLSSNGIMATAAPSILPGLSMRQRQLMNLDTSLTAAEAAAIHATAAATSLNSVNVAVHVAAASNTVEQFVAAMNAASATLASPEAHSFQQAAAAYASQTLASPATQSNIACPVCASCQTNLPAAAITACSCIHHHHCHHHHHSLCNICPSGSGALPLGAQSTPGFSGLSSMLSPGVSGLMGAASSSLSHSAAAAQSMVQQQANLLGFAQQQQQQNMANHQRNLELINPVHSSLLASRYMQQEREQQSANLFYQQLQQRQSLQQQQPGLAFTTTSSQLSQPLIALMPRMTQLTNLSMLAIFQPLQHPTDATLVLNGGTGGAPVQVGATQHAAAAAAAVPEPQPVGATVEQIKKYSSLMNYIKDPKVPEQEKERCTVCLMDFEHDESLRSLHCSHLFHIECIDRWLIYNKKCPVCRVDMDKVDYKAKACASASVALPLPIVPPNLLNFQ